MAINFPDSPTLNQEFTSGTTTWRYDGTKWNMTGFGPVGATGPTGPTGATGPVGPLDSLSDVSAESPTNGYFLQWNGTAWVPAAVSANVMTDTRNAAIITMDIIGG
jgi:hypothetical protein